MIISTEELKEMHPEIWNSLFNQLNGHGDFPCLFAIASFKKMIMKFVIADNKSHIVRLLSESLLNFSNHIKTERSLTSKTYETLVLICRENFYSDNGNYLEDLLIDLHNIDPCDWPKEKTKNINDQNFEFYWGGTAWFPIVLHQTHREKIRNSPFLMIGFQPGSTFDFNKKYREEFYERMRTSIHNKINKTYNESTPFYLSKNSSGKNICQYAGFDKKEIDINHQYPILTRNASDKHD
jgi:FPC/CPF motif-containing protein YcgG